MPAIVFNPHPSACGRSPLAREIGRGAKDNDLPLPPVFRGKGLGDEGWWVRVGLFSG